MAKIIYFNVPGFGHVNPSLPVVQELVNRGHQVIYYNTETFRKHIEGTGAEFRPYPDPSPTPEQITAMSDNLVNFTIMLMGESLRLLPFILNILTDEKPDLIMHDAICLWGHQAAVLANLPGVSTHSTLVFEGVPGILQPQDIFSAIMHALPRIPQLLRVKKQLIKRYGAAIFPNKDIFPTVADLNLLFTSRHFQPETPFINGRFRFVGPSINTNTRTHHNFPFDDLSDGPIVYISMGTIHQQTDEFYRTCYRAFADFPAQFVLALGKQIDAAALGPIPENFLVQPTVPQLELLPKVDLFITHGGINSVQEGLYFGVPLLVVPQQMEQMLNGRLAAKHGAAVLMGKRPQPKVTANQLKASVQNMLSHRSYANAAAFIGQTFQEAGGYLQAVAEIENYLDA